MTIWGPRNMSCISIVPLIEWRAHKGRDIDSDVGVVELNQKMSSVKSYSHTDLIGLSRKNIYVELLWYI